ncbi:sensor domain-containing diguanylate cyclase [Vreelandella arcis]|uniref:diguanylate cyclase n=1 Tax=Vreelandella arcis TaxID=416873 RepID=A0A1H0E6J4_9GAMM|nr:sensor domain-containing diguanylate cyclase [Halomonas arcis]SDN77898.1 PAS domain S-box-containing protein/diguanylate cyclase (GGDEF) domain-containing protein [Halomonas arcis]
MRSILPRLYLRLLLAVILPLILVTSTLWPVLYVHMETRLDGVRSEANAVLRVGEDALTRDINETLNYALAIAEMPALQQQLAAQQPPFEDSFSPDDSSRLATFLSTLMNHSPRYTKLVLIDNEGNEVLRASQGIGADPRFETLNHAHTDYFKGSSQLRSRELYISPPGRNLQYELFSGEVVPVVNVTTPVIDTDGKRQGIVLLSLNWPHLTRALHQSMQVDPEAKVLLVDAQGRWLLTQSTQQFPDIGFGGDFTKEAPEAWQLLSRQDEGYVSLDDHLLRFQSPDIRTQLYSGLAGHIFSADETLPWMLGVSFPTPSWYSLLKEETTVLWFLILIYAIAAAFGVFWAFTNHQQRKLRKNTQQQAAEVRSLYENAPCGYHSLDEDGTVIKMNQTELDWLGYNAEEVIGRLQYREVISHDTRDAFDAAFANVKKGQKDEAECTLLTHRGHARHVVIQASGYRHNGRFIYSRASVFDLTERKQLEEQLRAQAMTDPLTGVFNRRYLQSQAAIEMSRGLRHSTPLSLIAIDIDHFKRINDEYGHDTGDEVLKRFTHVMKGLLRQEDLLCRVGGEEFAILLPNTAIPQAQHIAERIRATVEHTQVSIDHETAGQTLRITASFGVTHILPHETTLKAALKRADTGLYEAKEAGRNRIVVKDN